MGGHAGRILAQFCHTGNVSEGDRTLPENRVRACF